MSCIRTNTFLFENLSFLLFLSCYCIVTIILFRFSPIHIPSLPIYNSRRPDKASNFVIDYLKSDKQIKNPKFKETNLSQNNQYLYDDEDIKWSTRDNNGKIFFIDYGL